MWFHLIVRPNTLDTHSLLSVGYNHGFEQNQLRQHTTCFIKSHFSSTYSTRKQLNSKSQMSCYCMFFFSVILFFQKDNSVNEKPSPLYSINRISLQLFLSNVQSSKKIRIPWHFHQTTLIVLFQLCYMYKERIMGFVIKLDVLPVFCTSSSN